jgi:V/A-type H+-transporting ATPase subunit B
MSGGIGDDKTRDDHSGVSDQLYSAYAEGRNLRDLVAVVGEDALTERDQSFLAFAQAFEDEFITQAKDEDRSIVETLDLGWKLLTILPKTELKRVKDEFIAKYYPE